MSAPSPTYDLVLLLDPEADSSLREKILADVRAMIAGDGEVSHEETWGERALAYPIAKKKSADYHLVQFHAGSAGLLSELGRTLRITDGVVRYRVIQLREGVGAPPEMPAAEPPPEEPAPAPAAVQADAETVEPEAAEPAPEEPAAETAPEPEAAAQEPGTEPAAAATEGTEA